MKDSLTIRAGAVAIEELRDGGRQADRFSALLGASGGPKWLVLSQMDRVLAGEFVGRRVQPLVVIGSSIGTYRHLCMALPDPVAAIGRFENAYVEQAYERQPTPSEVTEVTRRVLGELFGADGRIHVLESPTIHTHIVTVRSRWPVAASARPLLAPGLGAAALANALDRRLLGSFFERVVFHTGQPGAEFDGFATRWVPLSGRNLDDAVLASGSIPLVMEAVEDPSGAPQGRYRDGGIIDYHFDFEFDLPQGLALFPHFFDRITPGWFDKFLAWRRPQGRALARTVLVSPSREFVEGLPGGRVPDRSDFRSLSTSERQSRWREIVDRCRRLADDLADRLATGRLVEGALAFDDHV